MCRKEEEEDYVLWEIHSGICSTYIGANALVKKVMRHGYFWPTIREMTRRWYARVINVEFMITTIILRKMNTTACLSQFCLHSREWICWDFSRRHEREEGVRNSL